MASQEQGANAEEILEVTDGINHSFPTHQELRNVLKLPLLRELIIRKGGIYYLTDQGQEIYDLTRRETSNLLKMWEILEIKIKALNDETLT